MQSSEEATITTHTHTHTHTRLTALCTGLPGRAGTRKVKPIWILLKQETVSGICKSATCSRQITTPAPHHYRLIWVKGSPYSITEHRVLELILVHGSQSAGDVSHKPGGRLPLLSTRHAVNPATLKRTATNFAAW